MKKVFYEAVRVVWDTKAKGFRSTHKEYETREEAIRYAERYARDCGSATKEFESMYVYKVEDEADVDCADPHYLEDCRKGDRIWFKTAGMDEPVVKEEEAAAEELHLVAEEAGEVELGKPSTEAIEADLQIAQSKVNKANARIAKFKAELKTEDKASQYLLNRMRQRRDDLLKDERETAARLQAVKENEASYEAKKTTHKDVKDELVKLITDKINTTGQLPWSSGLLNGALPPVNSTSMKPYKGINLFLLSYLAKGTSQEFLTYHQVKELGGTVRKGSKGIPIVYWSRWNKKEHRPAVKDDEKDDCYFFLKKYTVFEIGDQVEGLKPRREIRQKENPPLTDAEDFIHVFVRATQVKFSRNHSISMKNRTAWYSPQNHEVQVAPRNEFTSSEDYVATCFHELVHSTGKAMGRPQNHEYEAYSKEEVIAEFGAALLCRHFGITSTEDNTAAYLQRWGKALKDNPDWLIQGANAAQKAVDYMMKVVEDAEIKEMLA